jgi:hypothetical protein
LILGEGHEDEKTAVKGSDLRGLVVLAAWLLLAGTALVGRLCSGELKGEGIY